MHAISFAQTTLPFGKQGKLTPNAQGYYRLVAGGLNVVNSNGARYSASEAVKKLFQADSDFHRKVTQGFIYAENGHPRRDPSWDETKWAERILDIQERRSCGHISGVYIGEPIETFRNPDGTAILPIYVDIKPAGELGHVLKESLANPLQNTALSIRSFSNQSFQFGKRFYEMFCVVTFDLVHAPGIPIAKKYMNPSLESEALITTQKLLEVYKRRANEKATFENSLTYTQEEFTRLIGGIATKEQSIRPKFSQLAG